MVKVLVVNALTLSRVPLSLIFCAILQFKVNPFLPCATLFALVAITDFWDGKLARKCKVQTDAGAVLDVISDFFFIVTSCSALYLKGMFPGWMLAVIIFKFLEFWISSALIKRNKKHTTVFLFDPLGRVVAVLFYLLPILVLLLQLWTSVVIFQSVLWVICAGIAILAFISSLFRISSRACFAGK